MKSLKPRIWMVNILVSGMIALVLSGCSTLASETRVLRFGLLPSEDQSAILESGAVLEQYLESQIDNLDVRLFVGPAYAASIEAMKAGELDFAFFGPFSYTLAKDSGANITAAMAIQDEESTPPGYWSITYTRADSGITSLEDLRGREGEISFAFSDAGSTSGFLAPSKLLLDAGLDLQQVRRGQILAGGHDRSAIATYSGQTQLGASFEGMLYQLCEQGQIDGVRDLAPGGNRPGDCTGRNDDPNDDLVTLQKFELPASPYAYRLDMDQELANQVITAMLEWKERDRATFDSFTAVNSEAKRPAYAIVRYTDDKFAKIREMCQHPELKDICPKP